MSEYFCLNYDRLIERAAEVANVRVDNGFYGSDYALLMHHCSRNALAVFEEVTKVDNLRRQQNHYTS
jgi:hypothetical protein